MAYRDEREALRAQKAELERQLAEQTAENEQLRRRLVHRKKGKRSKLQKRGSSSAVPWVEIEALIETSNRHKWRPAQVAAVGLAVVLAIGWFARGAMLLLMIAWCIMVVATAFAVAMRAPCCGRRLTATGRLLLQKTRQCPLCNVRFVR
jgi:hypothetical protein